jgi:hypothetical protein
MRSFGLLGLILTGILSNAQTLHQIKVNVPFTFTAAGRDLPAGEYHVFFNPSNSVVAVKGENTRTVFLMSESLNPSQDGQSFLSFHRYGQYQILEDVSIGGTVRRVSSGNLDRLLTQDSAQPNDKTFGAVTTPAVVTLTPEGEEN